MVDISGKRGKILSIVLVACLLVSGALIGGATVFQSASEKPLYQADKRIEKGKTEVITEESLSYIPKKATGVYTVAPQGQEDASQWWNTFKLITKYRLDLPVDIKPISENIKQMTLVQMPMEESFDEDLAVIIETENEEKAISTMEHLDLQNPNSDVASISFSDNLVFIASPTSFEATQEVVEGKGESIVSNKEFIEDTTGAKDSVFWFDVSGFFDSITGEGFTEEYPSFMENLQGNLMGLKDDTRWVGTSDNHGETWVGKFASGGYDSEKQDVDVYEQEAMSEITYFNEETGEEVKGDPFAGRTGSGSEEGSSEEGSDGVSGGDMFGGHFESGPGMMALEHVSVLTKADNGSNETDGEASTPNGNGTLTTGGVSDWTTGESVVPDENESLDYFDTVIMFSPSGLASAISGSGHSATNIHMHTLRIKGDTMEVSTMYTSDDPKNELIADKYEDIGEN